MADDIFQRAWGHYLSLIEALVGGETKQGEFQPYNLATLLPYSVDTPNYNLFLLNNAINFVSPTKPVAENEFQFADDQVRHPDKLTEGYQFFLNDLDVVLDDMLSADIKAEVHELKQELSRSRRDLRSRTREIDVLWADYLARNPGIPPNEIEARKIMWMWEYQYGAELEDFKREIRRVRVKIAAKQRQGVPLEYHKVIDAKARFEDPTQHMLLPPHAMFEDVQFKHMWRRHPLQFPSLSLDEFLQNANSVSRTRDTSDDAYHRVETHWKVKTKAKWKIFSGGGSAERRHLEEISEKETFHMTVSFDRIEEAPIIRDDWYADVLFTTVGQRFTDYWGPGGTLSSIPYSLIVARGTKIEIKVSSEYKKRVESYVRSKGSFSVGPFFSAGGDYSKDEKYMRHTTTDDGFKLEDGTNTIRLLGARVRNFNWNTERDPGEYYKELGFESGNLLKAL